MLKTEEQKHDMDFQHTHTVKRACFVYNFILCKAVSKSVEMFCFQQGNIELPEKCK